MIDARRRLIGPDDASQFWAKFREVYVAKEDIRFIKAASFNTVRVPLHWRLFVETDNDGGDRFAGPGWRLLDRLIAWLITARILAAPLSARALMSRFPVGSAKRSAEADIAHPGWFLTEADGRR